MNHVFAWPVGQEGGRRGIEGGGRSGRGPSVVYFAGALVGGSILGGVLAAGAVAIDGSLPSPMWGAITAAIALSISVPFQVIGRMGPFPQADRQVSRKVHQRLGAVGAAWWWGVEIGAGAFTRLYYATAPALAFALILLGRPWVALAAGVTFGATRGLGPILFRHLVRVPSRASRLEVSLASGLGRRSLELVLAVCAASLALSLVVGAWWAGG